MNFTDINGKSIKANQCYFCRSTLCFTRIYAFDLTFDEIACRDCQKELALYADKMLGNPGKMRNHISSSSKVKRNTFS